MTQRQAGNWLAGFKYFTSECESPNVFLYWAAMVTLSAATQRRVWLKWSYKPVYPNLYVKLIGPSGIGKGQAINFARAFLRAIEVPISAESGSREGLIDDLIQNMRLQEIGGNLEPTSPFTVISPDFMSFFRTSKESIIEWLTEIYDTGDFDHGWKYKLRNREVEVVPKPYVSMIAGTTEAWLADTFSAGFTEHGYAARVLFVHADEQRAWIARPRITAEMWEMRDRLVEDLKHISTLEGEFHVTEETWEWFETWYKEIWPKQRLDVKLRSYLKRKPLHLWKTAMLTQLANSDELVLTPEIMQFALLQLENLEGPMTKAFSGVGRNPLAGAMVRIWEDIALNKTVSKGDIIRRHGGDVNTPQIEEILNNLQLMGEIDVGLNQKAEPVYTIIRKTNGKAKGQTPSPTKNSFTFNGGTTES